jgi:hypothetical protein
MWDRIETHSPIVEVPQHFVLWDLKSVEVVLKILPHCLIPPCRDFNVRIENSFVQKASNNVSML